MMGRQEAPGQLFYEFDLERHVPANHMLREIDLFLDGDSLRELLRPFYSHLGRPSIDPELIIRMLVIGYVMGCWMSLRTDPAAIGNVTEN